MNYAFVCTACRVEGEGFENPVEALEGWMKAHSSLELDACERRIRDATEAGNVNPLVIIAVKKDGEGGLDG